MLYAIELMRQSMGQTTVGSTPPGGYYPDENAIDFSLVEVPQPSVQPGKKRRRVRCSKRPVFKRRRRVAAFFLLLLVALSVGGLLFLSDARRTANTQFEQVMTPAVEKISETVEDPTTKREYAGGEVSEKGVGEEESTAVPDDPTLYLTVPRLGLYGHTVRNDDSQAALDLGAVKLPSTEFPWQEGDTNTYVACHRLGWPGTESYNQCLNLPGMREGDEIFLEDANSTVYEYRVVEALIVAPEDTWVKDPVADKDTVSLQTCIESPEDLYTLGPNWRARFVVRAERIEEEGGFRKLAKDSVVNYGSFLRAPLPPYDSVSQATVRTAGGVARSLSQAVKRTVLYLP